MPFPVDNIKAACKAKGTTLAQLEKDLGFGNGVIARWKGAKGYPPYNRLAMIAKALDVSIGELTGEQKEKPSAEDGKGLHDTMYNALTPEEKDSVDLMIESLYKRRFGG